MIPLTNYDYRQIQTILTINPLFGYKKTYHSITIENYRNMIYLFIQNKLGYYIYIYIYGVIILP